MLILAGIEAGKILQLAGDVIVEGDIGEGAQITIQDGSLTIAGKVGRGVRIRVCIAPMLRKESVDRLSGPIFESGTIRQSTIILEGNIYLGAVNIDNRIFTEDQVIDHGQDQFTILPANVDYSLPYSSEQDRKSFEDEPNNGMVRAIIDDVLYMGSEIRIEGKKVFIAGEEVTHIEAVSHPLPPNIPCVVRIHGDIKDEVILESDARMEVNNIGNTVTVISEYEGLTARKIGEGSNIKVYGGLVVSEVDVNCRLVSKHAGLKADTIGAKTIVSVRGNISTTDVGDFCELKSEEQGIHASNIGSNGFLSANTSIQLHHVFNNSKIISKQGEVSVHTIHPHVTITAARGIEVRGTSFGPNSLILKNRSDDLIKRNQISRNTSFAKNPNTNKSSAVNSQFGTFFKPTSLPIQGVNIPKSFICPLTKNIMRVPMLLKLDGLSYEKEAITAWLLRHGSSPGWRIKVDGSKPINKILILNKTLLNGILEFLEHNPQLSEEEFHAASLPELPLEDAGTLIY